ncbi:hypothetical protein TNCV_1320981 [Trichonephila clavipes]|nr:hypothetical protein TNCV_1320981 [Trichonephila clavipes]
MRSEGRRGSLPIGRAENEANPSLGLTMLGIPNSQSVYLEKGSTAYGPRYTGSTRCKSQWHSTTLYKFLNFEWMEVEKFVIELIRQTSPVTELLKKSER